MSKLGFTVLTIGVMSADSEFAIVPLSLIFAGALITFIGCEWL